MFTPIQYRIPISAAILAVLIAFQSAGWILAVQGLLLGARIESQRAFFHQTSDVFEATFHQALFQKLKIGKKEIRLAGQLFDYRILSENSDSVHLALYHDAAEESLLAVLDQKINPEAVSKDVSAPPLTAWFAIWLGSAFLLPEKLILATRMESLFQQQDFISLPITAQFAPGVFAPPPEV